MKNTTLVYLIDQDKRLLLARKNRGLGMGLWNGAGGKLHDGESPEDAAVREMKEEFGVAVSKSDLIPIARLRFHFSDIPEWDNFAYMTHVWEGEPAESIDREMTDLTWFALDAIPYDEMWPDDRIWMPEVFAGNFVNGEFWLNDNNELLRHTIHATEPL